MHFITGKVGDSIYPPHSLTAPLLKSQAGGDSMLWLCI